MPRYGSWKNLPALEKVFQVGDRIYKSLHGPQGAAPAKHVKLMVKKGKWVCGTKHMKASENYPEGFGSIVALLFEAGIPSSQRAVLEGIYRRAVLPHLPGIRDEDNDEGELPAENPVKRQRRLNLAGV